MNRKRRIIYYDYKTGGFTVGEWLVYWSWQYFISNIDIDEYVRKIDYIESDMPGALDEIEWNEHTDYLKLLESNSKGH